MEQKKLGFFRRALISIKDFEHYVLFALEDTKKSLIYLFILMLIFGALISVIYTAKIKSNGIESIIENSSNEITQELNIDIREINEIVNKEIVIFFIILFVSLTIVYYLSALVDSLMLGLLGKIISRLIGIDMKFKAAFNIGMHALTLPVILHGIYMAVNILYGFEIKYFHWMYTTISYIYVLVAILMIKTEFISQKKEVAKIKEEQHKIHDEQDEPNIDEGIDDNSNKDKDKKEDENKDKKDKDDLAPEG